MAIPIIKKITPKNIVYFLYIHYLTKDFWRPFTSILPQRKAKTTQNHQFHWCGGKNLFRNKKPALKIKQK